MSATELEQAKKELNEAERKRADLKVIIQMFIQILFKLSAFRFRIGSPPTTTTELTLQASMDMVARRERELEAAIEQARIKVRQILTTCPHTPYYCSSIARFRGPCLFVTSHATLFTPTRVHEGTG